MSTRLTENRGFEAVAMVVIRLAGGHEDDLVQVEPGLHLTGRHQVAMVDRVERPTHHPKALRSGTRS
jgi:hypothetical protein